MLSIASGKLNVQLLTLANSYIPLHFWENGFYPDPSVYPDPSDSWKLYFGIKLESQTFTALRQFSFSAKINEFALHQSFIFL